MNDEVGTNFEFSLTDELNQYLKHEENSNVCDKDMIEKPLTATQINYKKFMEINFQINRILEIG